MIVFSSMMESDRDETLRFFETNAHFQFYLNDNRGNPMNKIPKKANA